MTLTLILLVSYLVGAIPFGYVIARSRGVDLLSQGSKNIGATNVGRVMGLWWGVLVFTLDFLKGAGPVFAAGIMADESTGLQDFTRTMAGVAAFIGHLFPVYLGFRGGKGVATGAGVAAVLVPWLWTIVLLVWAVVLLTTRYMSLASLTGAVLLIVLRLTTNSDAWSGSNIVITTFCVVASVAVIVRHTPNIRRLINGTENRLGGK
ncbi:MAG: glycerol-3-phosphate 1-O-acyltransferase [Planctomycetia bacterium]|nr:glycerol-3-phosphate 1-O-acyltransferase [Planctomycetia bacterium]